MRGQLDRPAEARVADKVAEVAVPGYVLRVEWQPVERRRRRAEARSRAAPLGPRDREQAANDRLDAFLLGRSRERHRAVEPVTVAYRDRRETALDRQPRDRLGIDRAL